MPALQIERSGRSVTFPIVTDDRAWRDTTVEEALYAILVDARGWSRARLDDASISALDPETQREAPLIKRDFASEMERVNELVEVLGGDGQLQALYAAAGV